MSNCTFTLIQTYRLSSATFIGLSLQQFTGKLCLKFHLKSQQVLLFPSCKNFAQIRQEPGLIDHSSQSQVALVNTCLVLELVPVQHSVGQWQRCRFCFPSVTTKLFLPDASTWIEVLSTVPWGQAIECWVKQSHLQFWTGRWAVHPNMPPWKVCEFGLLETVSCVKLEWKMIFPMFGVDWNTTKSSFWTWFLPPQMRKLRQGASRIVFLNVN